jgi:hypothetical protein
MQDPAARQSRTTRDGLICALAFAACFWVAWPIAEMGFLDDWSYIKTAQIFAETGHLVYNGWATATLGWQIGWGALFIRVFGFSFTAAKLSTFPIAMATVVLFHAILIQSGITRRNAIIGTLTLALSPLFMPLAASFMSDVPGLFVILLCLYCCQRAVTALTPKAAILWLCLAATSNMAGGTARQIAWLGALVMVPCTGWLLRKQRGVLLTSLLLWLGTIGDVLFCLHWFAEQPYSVSEVILRGAPATMVNAVALTSIKMLGECLCLLLVVYPVLAAWLPEARKLNKLAIAIVAIVAADWGVFEWMLKWPLPWIPDTLLAEFAPARDARMSPALGQFILPAPICLAISLLVVTTALIFVAANQSKSRELENAADRAFWHEAFWLFVPFTLCYFLLLMPRAWHAAAFDRYLLPIMALAILCLIRLYQERVAPALPRTTVVLLAIYAVFAIAGTHNWFAWQRARLAAIDEIRAAGIPRTAIQGGFEYDGWTQIDNGGHINDPRILVPADAYQPNLAIPQVAAPCRLDFASFTPVVQPKYTAALGLKPCLNPSKFLPVKYRAWLSPFERTVYVQQIPAANGQGQMP